MIPIRDHNPTLGTPYVTYALIAVNVLVYLSYFPLQDNALIAFYQSWAIIPADVAGGRRLVTVLTAMFLHAGILHLAGNMLFLFIFGDNLEEFFGHVGYLAVYLVSGVAATALQVGLDPASVTPNLGASGAIAGVMGGYLILFPRARVDVLIPIVVIPWIVTVPAVLVLALWFGLQVLGGYAEPMDQGGVAYWAHVGGFLAGLAMVVVALLAGRRPNRVDGRPDNPPIQYRRAVRKPGPWG